MNPSNIQPAARAKTIGARAALTVTLLLGAAPVMAQSAPPPAASEAAAARADGPVDEAPLENSGEIVVTAQLREQRLRDVPVAVSVVTGDSLMRQNLTTLNDVAVRLPNVKIASGPIANTLTIRGVGSGPNPGFEQAVATFVDGLYRSRSRSTRAALFDLERIEVLKGPQTTFFGANAIAGALNIITRKPRDEFATNASVVYTPETNEYDAQFGVSAPLAEGLALRLAGRASGGDGYIYNTRLQEDGPHDRTYQGRLSLRWDPVDWIRTDLRVEGSTSNSRNSAPFQVLGCPPDSRFTMAVINTCRRHLAQNGGVTEDELDYRTAIGETSSSYDFVEAGLTNSVDIGSGTLTSISGYFWHENVANGQGIPFPLADAVIGTDGFPNYQGERYEQYSQELRYQSEAGGTFEYMFGGYFGHGEINLRSIVGFRYQPFGARDTTRTFNASSPLGGNNVTRLTDRNLSAFGSMTFRPIDRLRINLGARYSTIDKTANRVVTPGLVVGTPSPETYTAVTPAQQAIIASAIASNRANFVNPERTDDKFMPSASVQFDVLPTLMAYVSYANGFKAGGYSIGANNDEFGPETVNAYEFGLKGSFFDRRLSADIALYRSDYTNLQETSLQLQPNGSITSLVQNVASSRTQGVEFNSSLRAAPWLTLTTALAYLDSKYTSYPNGACTIYGLTLGAGCRQDLSGKRRSFAPEWSGNVGARITSPIGSSNRLTIEPLLYFSSRYFLSATADDLLEQEGYAKLDLRVAFGPEDGPWEVALIGKNLTDEVTSQFRQSVVLAPGTISALVDPPRTVAIQLTFNR